MKVYALVLFITLSFGSVSAQIDAQAAALLICAQEALGTAATDLLSVRSLSTVTYYAPGEQPVLELSNESLIDFAQRRFRTTFFQEGVAILLQQLSAEASFTNSPQTGTLDLPPSQREELRQAFVTSPYALRLGTERDSAIFVGEVTLEGVSGTQLDVVTEGIATSLVFGEDCLLLAEVTLSSELGQVVTLYSDYRSVEGLLLPFSASLYAGGALFARSSEQEVAFYSDFSDDLFSRP